MAALLAVHVHVCGCSTGDCGLSCNVSARLLANRGVLPEAERARGSLCWGAKRGPWTGQGAGSVGHALAVPTKIET